MDKLERSRGNPDRITDIVLDGLFEGTYAQWRDCFFDNPTIENVVAFAQQEGCAVEITCEGWDCE